MILQGTLQAKLEAGLLEMGLQISVEKQAKLIAYLLLIDKWNKVHNLTSVRDPLEMVTLHLLDSLSVLPYFQHSNLQCKSLLDVGAGAGLPSIPLAICLPELQVTAIDSVQKKTSFMRQVKGELGLGNFNVESGRVELLKKEAFNQGLGFDAIISRAFAEISLFIKLTRHLLSAHGQWFAMKGIVPTHEFESQDFIRMNIQPSKIEVLNVAGLKAERHLIILTN
ncbi:MAG: 16S rRNA (guanine(527)-N(7))-methyltransferase RsmG [Methylotenera sp.]